MPRPVFEWMELNRMRLAVPVATKTPSSPLNAMWLGATLLPIVVLKSPHHGSATSSSAEFINAVKPALVVVSSGRANPYGHPVPPVLERYKAIGARVLRTDQLGQIEIVTDGQTLNHEGHEEK